MKKVLFIIFILTLLLWLAGCTKPAVVKDQPSRSNISTTEDNTKIIADTTKEPFIDKKADAVKGGKGSITALTRAAAGGHVKIA
jgi:hypothetical protein